MSLLKKLASRTSIQHSNNGLERQETRTRNVGSEQNAENLNLLDVHWNNSRQIMCLDEKTVTPREKCKILVYHLNEIIVILANEKEDNLGPCLKYVLDEEIFQILYLWSSELPGSLRDFIMRTEQMKIYRRLIDKCSNPFFLYEQVWKPLLFLLHSCEIYGVTAEMEEDFVSVLKCLCVSVNRDITLLDLFFLDNHNEREIESLSVFSLLIPYLHRDGNVGAWARDAVLLCMALSSVDHRLGNYIIEKTNFCPVIATGLSGLFSDLPTSLDIPSEDWYSLERGLWATFPELVSFLTSLEFCNNVIQIAHPKVQSMLLELIYNGFLVSVMSSALSQSSVEALTAVTAYIDLFIRSITDSKLMSVFVKFILTEKCDGVQILEYLVSRISQESQLSVVSLGLFYTLLDLNCEDIMYTLVLQYLIPCSHILSSQKRTVREVDFYSKSAVKFLSLIPSCCDLYHQTSIPVSPSSSSESLHKSVDGHVKIDLEKSHDLVLYRPQLLDTPYSEVQSDYMEYLTDARAAIRYCAKRCACWSSPYDGADLLSTDSPTEERRRSCIAHVNGAIAGRRPSDPRSSFTGSESKKLRSASDFDSTSAETCLGPFLNTIIKKLENMHNNTFYVNLILTAVISRLSYYPQPLLKSFLLNYNMVLKPGVRSLFQILSSLKIKVENVVENVDGLEKLLRRARKNLLLREEKSKAGIQTAFIEPRKHTKEHKKVTIADSIIPRSPKNSSRSRAENSLLNALRLLKDGPPPSLNKAISYGSIDTNSSSSSLSLTESIETPESMSPEYGSFGDLSDTAGPTVQSPVVSRKVAQNAKQSSDASRNTFKRKNPKTIKNAVYCVIVLEEWLKELAAVSQEHALWPMEVQEMAATPT